MVSIWGLGSSVHVVYGGLGHASLFLVQWEFLPWMAVTAISGRTLCSDVESSLGYMGPCLKIQKKKKKRTTGSCDCIIFLPHIVDMAHCIDL